MTDHPDVAVGLIHPGEWSASFGESLVDLMLYEAARTGMPPYLLSNRCSSGAIVDGRNQVTASFLATKANWLLFVDADMGFSANALEQLLATAHPTERPVVGGLCFGQRRVGIDPTTHAQRFVAFPTIYRWREFHDRVGFEVIPDYPKNEVVAVSATGAAFILIHRDVLETVRAYAEGDIWFTPAVHPVGPTTFSEDMSFCIRAQACDFPIHVNTAVKTCHDKGGIFLDEAAWEADKAAFDADQPTHQPQPEPVGV